MRLFLFFFLILLGCKAEPTVLGGDTASDGSGDTASDTGDSGDTDSGTDAAVCLGDWAGTATFTGEDPRSGETLELCTGDVEMTIAADLTLSGSGGCASGNTGDPGMPPMDFALELVGAATEACALTAEVTLTYGPEDTTDTVPATGTATADAATLTWDDELQPPEGGGGPDEGGPSLPYTGTLELSR